jgi:hypothetical protein
MHNTAPRDVAMLRPLVRRVHNVQQSEQKTACGCPVAYYIQMEHHFIFCHIYNVYTEKDLKLVVQ